MTKTRVPADPDGLPDVSTPSVLRGAALEVAPRVLRRPASAATVPDGRDGAGTAGREILSVPVESLPGYEPGVRAGFEKCETMLRARQQDAVDAGFRAGFEQGQRQGIDQGLAEGREAGNRMVEEESRSAREATASRLARLDQIIAALPEAMARRLAEAEEDMIALCHEVICRILGERLATEAGVADQVRQAIRGAGGAALQAGARGNVAIHVHPRDLAILEADAELTAWIVHQAATGSVQWVGDERVLLGGCLVRSAEGTLDARLETQLAGLRRLLGAEGRDEAGPRAGGASGAAKGGNS